MKKGTDWDSQTKGSSWYGGTISVDEEIVVSV